MKQALGGAPEGEIPAQATDGPKPAPNAQRCGALTRRGGVCTAPGNMNDGRCPHHTATVSEKLKAAWRQRGHVASMRARMPLKFTPADLTSADSARALVEETINLARAGKLPTSTANAISKLVAVGLKTAELKLAERIAEIEARLAEARKPR